MALLCLCLLRGCQAKKAQLLMMKPASRENKFSVHVPSTPRTAMLSILSNQVAPAPPALPTSAESRPALSQMVAGSARSALAKAPMARDFLPGVVAARSSTALAMRISHCGRGRHTVVTQGVS